MKFSKLEFKPHLGGEGVQARINFDNGYGASIVQTKYSYGHEKGLYELAVMRNGFICYDTPITNDVIGYLNKLEVEELLIRIKNLSDRDYSDTEYEVHATFSDGEEKMIGTVELNNVETVHDMPTELEIDGVVYYPQF